MDAKTVLLVSGACLVGGFLFTLALEMIAYKRPVNPEFDNPPEDNQGE